MKRVVMMRTYQDVAETLGHLAVIGKHGELFHCYTLELPWRLNKRNISCIPVGEYQVRWEYSPKFGRFLYELKEVPGRSEVKFHPANYVSQLNGCIALGMRAYDINRDGLIDMVDSRKALEEFHRALDGVKRFPLTIYGEG